MLKAVSLFLIVFSFALTGRYAAFYDKQKALTLREAVSFITNVENRLRYSREPLASLVNASVHTCGENFTDFLLSVCSLLEAGKTFPEAWSEALGENRDLLRCFGDFSSLWLDFGSELGTTDIEGQLASCGYYKSLFEAELKVREENCTRSSKLFPPLGFLLGISAAILII